MGCAIVVRDMTTLDPTPPSEDRLRHRNWARRILSGIAGLLACLCLFIAVSNFERGGWSNERTILYAAEGGLMSPREALMHGLIFGTAMLIWFGVFAATMASPNSRARRIFRAAAAGAVIELALGAAAGGLCGDLSGLLVISGTMALPMALVAIVVRRESR